jgi:Tol biopolymer transport system component
LRVVSLAALVAAALLAGAAQGGHASAKRSACGLVLCGDRLPSWSPDGRTIAFVHYVRGPTGPRQTILTVPARGGSVRSLLGPGALYPRKVDGPLGPFAGIAWSPDSRSLALSSWRSGGWLVSADGGAARQAGDLAHSWSTDGRTIAFTSLTNVGTFRPALIAAGIATIGADGSGVRFLAGSPGLEGGRWASDPLWSAQNEIAYITGDRHPGSAYPNGATAEIWSIRPDGSGARRLVAATGGYPRLLGWLPDGQRLFFRFESGSLEVVNRDGSSRSALLAGDFPCCWLSPDAERVAGLRRRADGGVDLYVVDVGSGRERRVAHVARRANVDVSVSWSPDGDRLAFVGDGECHGLLGVQTVTVFGSDLRRLTARCRREGTGRPDVMRGGPGPDALYGRRGRDAIEGAAGGDFLQGGAGDDIVRGGVGDDRLYGGPGRDRLEGGDGADAVYARGGGKDVIRCGPGRDAARADREDAVARDCEIVERR